MYPTNKVKVYGVDPMTVTREDVMGKKVVLMSSCRSEARTINLSKMGKVVEIVEYEPHIKQKIRVEDPFMVKLESGNLLPSFSLWVFEETLAESLNGAYKKMPHKVINLHPAFPKPSRTDYKRLLNGSFTCEFLFVFFKRLVRDIRLGWEDLQPMEELFAEIPNYTGEEFDEKNTRLFEKLYNFAKENT